MNSGSRILLVVEGEWLRVGKTALSVELCRRQDLAGVREADGRQRPSVSGQRKATYKWNLRPIFFNKFNFMIKYLYNLKLFDIFYEKAT